MVPLQRSERCREQKASSLVRVPFLFLGFCPWLALALVSGVAGSSPNNALKSCPNNSVVQDRTSAGRIMPVWSGQAINLLHPFFPSPAVLIFLTFFTWLGAMWSDASLPGSTASVHAKMSSKGRKFPANLCKNRQEAGHDGRFGAVGGKSERDTVQKWVVV